LLQQEDIGFCLLFAEISNAPELVLQCLLIFRSIAAQFLTLNGFVFASGVIDIFDPDAFRLLPTSRSLASHADRTTEDVEEIASYTAYCWRSNPPALAWSLSPWPHHPRDAGVPVAP
jgi:hypothetical protein